MLDPRHGNGSVSEAIMRINKDSKRIHDDVTASPLKLGLASASLSLFGILCLTALTGPPVSVWLFVIAPIVAGMLVKLFLHSRFWWRAYMIFAFLLNTIVFALPLWYAFVLNLPNGTGLVPLLLVFALAIGGVFGGYQLSKNLQKQLELERRSKRNSSNEQMTISYITIAGRRVSVAPIGRVSSWIRALTPLLIAVGLNSAEILSLQTIYWLFGGIGLIFVVFFTMAIGAVWYQTKSA